MQKLILDPTEMAQWHHLLSDAQSVCDTSLETDIESYLLFLLMRFANRPDMIKSILGLEFLDSFNTMGIKQQEKLREVADKCLLFSGFFPGIAERRNVSVNYFIEMGQGAYRNLAGLPEKCWIGPYPLLCESFIAMMDVLLTMRDMDQENHLLSPLHALELWEKTDSQYAFDTLQKVKKSNNGFIISGDDACH